MFRFSKELEILTAIALKTSERRSQASLGRELEVETAIAICSGRMHGAHYKRIARSAKAAIAVYLFKTDPAALEGCDLAPFKSNAVR